jgi:foldase protein PrsA
MVTSNNERDAKSSGWLKTHLGTVVVIAVVVVAAGLYFLRGQLVVALVNGSPIYRKDYVAALEAQGGKQVLEQLILERLIQEEAAEKNISVSDEEIEAQIATIGQNLAAGGQDLDEALAENGMTRQQLVEQIRVSKLLEMLASQASVDVSDEEVDAYLEENKEFLSGTEDEEELRTMVREQLQTSKDQDTSKSYLEELQAKATIEYW